MQVVHQRCCGLDVHKKTVVACILILLASGEVQKHVRTFSTMTADLLALADWLKAFQVTHVALESTGVFTPPPMLQIGGGILRSGDRRDRADTEDHTDVLFIDLNPFDQSTNNITTRLEISIVESTFDFRSKSF